MSKSKEVSLLEAAVNAGATISAVYQWLERIEKAGGATSISGIAECNAMLKSLRKNADRTEALVMVPLRRAIEEAPQDKKLAHEINFEAWSRTLIGFIRHKGLEQELKDWSGGWPCPIGSTPESKP